jgi:putative transposase
LEKGEPTADKVGIDVGLNLLYTDSDGQTVANPRHLRKSEKSLRRLQRRMSKTKKGSKNRAKLRNKLARKYLKVSRRFVKTLLSKRQCA